MGKKAKPRSKMPATNTRPEEHGGELLHDQLDKVSGGTTATGIFKVTNDKVEAHGENIKRG